MKPLIFSISGWVGMILILVGYWLISHGKLKNRSLRYHFLNFFGGIGLIASTIYTKSWPAAVLNLFWIGIAAFFIYKKLSIKPVYKELR